MQYNSRLGSSHIIEAGYRTPAFTPHKPYVLIVDDDYAILSVILLLLETEDYAGLGILDSRNVISFLEQVHTSMETDAATCLPAVILLDLMMPMVSGHDIAAFTSKKPWSASIPIIAMTADPALYSKKSVPGAVDLLNKPFQIDVLLAKLACYLTPSVLI
jgi:CheY-like chemotaxis protein